MLVQLRKCNNIETGSVEIKEQTLNLKYAINGSGKTTIARAVLASINERIGTEKNALAALTPFKYRLDASGKPEVIGTEAIQSVKVFDEKYINDFVFQADELLKGSFDIFIRGEAYEQGMKEIDIHVAAMQKALSEDKDITDLIADFNEISSSFGKETKSGIHASSGLAKAFKDGNKVANIPAGLEPYKSYIQHPENYKWVGWQLGGLDFMDIGSDCPYCTSDIKEKRETIKRVSEIYKPKAIENLNKIVSAFHRLNKYFSEETKAKIAEFVECMEGYTTDQADFLKEVRSQIDRLGDKFVKAQRLGFSSLKDVDKVLNGLNDHRIDLSLFVHLNSENTKQKAEIVNAAIDKLVEQAAQLHGMIKKQKQLIENLVKEHSAGINAFLQSAGYAYQVALLDDGAGQHRLKLVHSEMQGEITNAKAHLSYGERNAFALVLFMYDVLKTNPDLVVLDDPISSFDKNKKYAIVDMLFRKGTVWGTFTLPFIVSLLANLNISADQAQEARKKWPTLSYDDVLKDIDDIGCAHTTNVGGCRNDYSQSPCEKHYQCLRNCRSYRRKKGDKDEIAAVTKRRQDAEMQLEAAKMDMTQEFYGANTWVSHHQELILGCNKSLDIENDDRYQVGEIVVVFPDGDEFCKV